MSDKIDYARAAYLMDVVAKVTTVAPRCTSLLASAMDELFAMDHEVAKEREAMANERLKSEQEAVARIAEKNRQQAEYDAMRLTEEEKNRLRSGPVPSPALQLMPGQPVAPVVQAEVKDPGSQSTFTPDKDKPLLANPSPEAVATNDKPLNSVERRPIDAT